MYKLSIWLKAKALQLPSNFFLSIHFILIVSVYTSCNNRKPESKLQGEDLNPPSNVYFDSLILSKTQYQTLKSKFQGNAPKDKLIVQFYFDVAARKPTLAVYPMRSCNDSITDSFEAMGRGGASTLKFETGQILGDQEVSIRTLNDLVGENPGGKPIPYDSFYFIPSFTASNRHVYYKILVYSKALLEKDFSTKGFYSVSSETNPSPPAKAE